MRLSHHSIRIPRSKLKTRARGRPLAWRFALQKGEGERDEDAVDTEGNEGVGADVGEQEFYGDDGDKKRGNEACRQNSELLRREGGGFLVEVVQRGGEHGRHRKQEGELHDRAAR